MAARGKEKYLLVGKFHRGKMDRAKEKKAGCRALRAERAALLGESRRSRGIANKYTRRTDQRTFSMGGEKGACISEMPHSGENSQVDLKVAPIPKKSRKNERWQGSRGRRVGGGGKRLKNV